MREATERVLFLITIDTECDHDPKWTRSQPLAFRSVCEGVPQRLQPLFEAVGAVPAYLLTVEVMEDRQCVDTLRSLHGHFELGTHLHSAFIEPQKKYQDYAGVDSPDFQCHCAPEIEYEKLANLTRLFQREFGYAPRSFRAGRFGAGPNTIDALERLGYLVDTSVTPYMLWEHPDGPVDYRDAPEQPYAPAPGSLTRRGRDARGIVEIPVSMRPRFLRNAQWLRPWMSSVESMKEVVRYQLKRHARSRTVVLNMMFHSMEVIPQATPYPQSEEEVSRYLDALYAILAWCRDQGYGFVSPTVAAEILMEEWAGVGASRARVATYS